MSQMPAWDPNTVIPPEEATVQGDEPPEPAASGDDKGADDKPPEDAAKAADPAEPPAEPAKKEPEKEPEKPKPIETRTPTKQEHIEARLRRKEAREKALAEGKDPTEDSDIAPEDKEMVKTVLKDEYADYFAEIEQTRAQNEIDKAISSSRFASEFTPEDKARFSEHAMHPAYAGVAFENLAVIALGADRLMQMGAKLERDAAAKSAATKK